MHKCLTQYYISVMTKLWNWKPYQQQYIHLESLEGIFYNTVQNYKVVSTNGFAIDIERLTQPFRITRFIRDPRDLIVSGYFYHKRGAEPWFRFSDPTNRYWSAINGNVPEGIKPKQSYSDYLNSVDTETGLIAEMQFRRFHFESLRQWPEHTNIKVFRYEDIIYNEKAVFAELFSHYQLSSWQRFMGQYWVGKYALNKQANNKHVRNASPRQWQDVFTNKAHDYFMAHYSDILKTLEY